MSSQGIDCYGVFLFVLLVLSLAFFFLCHCTQPIAGVLIYSYGDVGRYYLAAIQISYGYGYSYRCSLCLLGF